MNTEGFWSRAASWSDIDSLSGASEEGDAKVVSASTSSRTNGGSNSASSSSGQADVKQIEQLASRETRSLRFWRFVVAMCILVAGAAVSAGTYEYLDNQVQRETKLSFELLSENIEELSRIRFRDIFDCTHAMSKQMTAAALDKFNSTFPFVAFNMFEVYGFFARNRSSIDFVTYTPIVKKEDKKAFEEFFWANHIEWMNVSRVLQSQLDFDFFGESDLNSSYVAGNVSSTIISSPLGVNSSTHGGTDRAAPYLPAMHISPPTLASEYLMVDFSVDTHLLSVFHAVQTQREALVGATEYYDPARIVLGEAIGDSTYQMLYDKSIDGMHMNTSEPHATVVEPVFDGFDKNANLVGYILGIVSFDEYLSDLIPNDVVGVYVVVKNNCNATFTYKLEGINALFLGPGDLHDPAFDGFERSFNFNDIYRHPDTTPYVPGHCVFEYYIYPSQEYEDSFDTNQPVVFTLVIALIFLVMATTFFVYDRFVERRNRKIVDTAARFNAIVSSLFPSNVRERLLADNKKESSKHVSQRATKSHLKTFLATEQPDEDEEAGVEAELTKPIADLFSECTIMFADICGFTAWSSVREPSQVFTLLESVYRGFDQIAKRRRVFKVETVGDCYVAVCGLPDPRNDHAVVMARFAMECMRTFESIVKRLEVSLGPDTGELNVRIGLNSGPVTAGVLRGDRSRFQLFGDAVNTTARMESSSLPGRIQVSSETADFLTVAGKGTWLKARTDIVYAKGKGKLHTYWLAVGSSAGSRSDGGSSNTNSTALDLENMGNARVKASAKTNRLKTEKSARLIDWNVEVLLQLLKHIIARRQTLEQHIALQFLPRGADQKAFQGTSESGRTVLEEVKEIIALPDFDKRIARTQVDVESIELDQDVVIQLWEFVSEIATMYNDHPFHNFEHASHVTMSVVKLLSRIVAPSEVDLNEDGCGGNFNNRGTRKCSAALTLHDHTYGITSDPLTQFACVLSALIHDVAHPGVPNSTLIEEKAIIAIVYKNKSIAEQNSLDLAWNLLMDDKYDQLRNTIYATEEEMKRFRQLVVNSVAATDIVDRELKAIRNDRWEKAFSDNNTPDGNVVDARNRKATIVIEHLIQASDVAHTMQHWHIYRKWNERFFRECYVAYKNGRSCSNPADTWYQGELGFFDFYILPLAKKLKECGVFGASSDEYLTYAKRNRSEWESRGEEAIREMMQRIREEMGESDNCFT